MATKDIASKWRAGKTVFLFNELEDAVLKWMPSGEWYCKLSGKEEYLIAEDSNMVTDAYMAAIEITEEKYEKH